MAFKFLITLSVFNSFACSQGTNSNSNQPPTFKFNLPREIHSLDPLLLRGTAKRYALFNLHRGLFYYDKDSKLKNFGAESCNWKNELKLQCRLANKKWSNGKPVLAEHYVYSYNQILKLKDESLSFVKNIKGIKTLDSKNLIFELKKENKAFAHKLTDLAFSPRNQDRLFQKIEGQLFSGPYKVTKLNESFLDLNPNIFFDDHKRPSARGVFVDDPNAALNMYNAYKLDFLRYLESSLIHSYDNVYMAPFAKMDGLFIKPSKTYSLDFRKALILALDLSLIHI